MPLHTLPLATTTPFTPWGEPGDRDAQGWGQALARAAGASLPQQDAGGSAVRSTQASPAAFTVPPCLPQEVFANSRPAGAPFEAPAASCARPGADVVVWQPLQVAHSHTQATPDSRAIAHTAPDGTDEIPDLDPGRPRSQHPATSERSPVRVHVEQHAAGLAVWLGVDGGPIASARVAATLARLRTDGAIVSLVCNGIPLHDRSRLPKEAP